MVSICQDCSSRNEFHWLFSLRFYFRWMHVFDIWTRIWCRQTDEADTLTIVGQHKTNYNIGFDGLLTHIFIANGRSESFFWFSSFKGRNSLDKSCLAITQLQRFFLRILQAVWPWISVDFSQTWTYTLDSRSTHSHKQNQRQSTYMTSHRWIYLTHTASVTIRHRVILNIIGWCNLTLKSKYIFMW